MTVLVSVFSELRQVRIADDADPSPRPFASSHGVLEFDVGPFGPVIRVLRDGNAHPLAFETAKALFGAEAIGKAVARMGER